MLGLRSCIFQVWDINTAALWYKKVLQKEPYFQNDNYVGFDVWWHELGIFKRKDESIKLWNNVEIYWWVDDVASELTRLVTLWATISSPLEDVWWWITMGSIIDPFGNIFGIIHNPNSSAK